MLTHLNMIHNSHHFLCVKVKTDEFDMTIVRGHVGAGDAGSGGPVPACRFVNVELCGTAPDLGSKGTLGTVLLENPRGDFPISLNQLTHQVMHPIYATNENPFEPEHH